MLTSERTVQRCDFFTTAATSWHQADFVDKITRCAAIRFERNCVYSAIWRCNSEDFIAGRTPTHQQTKSQHEPCRMSHTLTHNAALGKHQGEKTPRTSVTWLLSSCRHFFRTTPASKHQLPPKGHSCLTRKPDKQ